jgi:phthiocerol/phenolphthiocerol synthesis type-I polyketide synthase E
VFAAALDDCAERLRVHLGLDLRDVLYPSAGRDAEAAARLAQTRLTQPALFAVEYALAKLWESKGIRPTAMLGHSVGEYAAACLAGVFGLDDALATVAARGRLMQAQPAGAMLSVPLAAAEVEALLPDRVELAADNAPRLSVVAGPAADIEAFAAALAARDVPSRPLHTSHAFHSALIAPAVEEFAAYLRGVELRPPSIPVLSNVTGDWLRPDEATDPWYWARQLREPVRFDRCARRLLATSPVVLEVGPGTTLAMLVRQQDGASATTVVSSLSHPGRPRPDGTAVADAVGRLWLAGADMDLSTAWAGQRRRRLALPTYPFEPTRHWVDAPAAAPAPVAADASAVDAPAAVDVAPIEPDVVEVIRRIWVELLGAPDVGPHDDFFELGGHSLLGTRIVARLREAFDVDLSGAALFEAPTIAQLAATVERLRASSPEPEDLLPDLLPDLLAEIRAMSPEQLREQLAGNRPA